MQGLVVS